MGTMPTARVRIEKKPEATDAAIFQSFDEAPPANSVPAYLLKMADAENPDELNMDIKIEAAANSSEAAIQTTITVDGLDEDDVRNMVDAGRVVLEAGFLDDTVDTVFTGSLGDVSWTFESGRERYTLVAGGKPPDIFEKPVTLHATLASGLTIGDMLRQVQTQAAISIDVPPEADGDFSRIPSPPRFVEPLGNGVDFANVAFVPQVAGSATSAVGRFDFSGTVSEAIDELIARLRTAIRYAKGVERAFVWVPSTAVEHVRIFDSGTSLFTLDGEVLAERAEITDPDDIISMGRSFKRSASAAATGALADDDDEDAVDATGETTIEEEVQLVIGFDRRVYLGLLVSVNVPDRRPVSFVVRSYVHELSWRKAWRTTIKGIVKRSEDITEAVYGTA
jgi:hypothetical protein